MVRKTGQMHLNRIVSRNGNKVAREDPIKAIALGMREEVIFKSEFPLEKLKKKKAKTYTR